MHVRVYTYAPYLLMLHPGLWIFLQELCMNGEEFSAQADLLLDEAADIQLSPKNQTLLLQQAQFTREAVTQLQEGLGKKYVTVPCILSFKFDEKKITDL